MIPLHWYMGLACALFCIGFGGFLMRRNFIMMLLSAELMLNAVLEDLTGSCEVLIWPKAYEENRDKLQEDAKIFLEGNVRLQEDRDAVLAVDQVILFDDMPRNLWIRFASLEEYEEKKEALDRFVDEHGGQDQVIVYVAKEKAMKRLPSGQGVRASEENVALAGTLFGSRNVSLQ